MPVNDFLEILPWLLYCIH